MPWALPIHLALAARDGAPDPAPLAPEALVYLALAVSLLLFLLLFVVIGLNVARRIARWREALRRLHDSPPPAPPAESAWSAAGKRATPIPDTPADPDTPDDDQPGTDSPAR